MNFNNLKFRIGFVLLVIIGFAISIPFSVKNETNRLNRHYEELYKVSIAAKIYKIDKSSKYNRFGLKNSQKDYIFVPIRSKTLNDNENFTRLAEMGDSIYKNKNSDTLYLFKPEGKKYIFPFKKF